MTVFRITGDRPAARIQAVLETEARKQPRDFEQEVLAVWRATCEERAKLGKGPVLLAQVQLVDRCAQGHIDYGLKLALGCEKLVLHAQ
jgi:hypothetical protein